MGLCCISISRKNNSQEALEQCEGRSSDQLYLPLKVFHLEGVVIQTCLRTEIYWINPEKLNETEVIRRGSELFNLDFEYVQIQSYSNSKAMEHLFRLTSGLESAILGEHEILGQVKTAVKEGLRQKTIKSTLQAIFHHAINLGVEIRKQTEISKGNISVGSVAVETIKKIVGTKISSMIIVGAGEVAGLVGKSLSQLEITELTWMNRTYERSLMMAKIFKAVPLEFNQINLRDSLAKADVMIFAAGCSTRLLQKEDFINCNRENPILLIDLGNPRNIDPEIEKFMHWVQLIDLDYINEWSKQNNISRMKEIPHVERLIDESIANLRMYLHSQQFEPHISQIYRSAEAIRKKQIEKAIPCFQQDTPNCLVCQDKLEILTRAIVKQLLDTPIRNIRQMANILPSEDINSLLLLFKKESIIEKYNQDPFNRLALNFTDSLTNSGSYVCDNTLTLEDEPSITSKMIKTK